MDKPTFINIRSDQHPFGCSKCKKKRWFCLVCNTQISYENFHNEINSSLKKEIAVYCDCCNHNFICISCYDKSPSYDSSKQIFGNNHCITDRISNETSQNRLRKAISENNVKPSAIAMIKGTPVYLADQY